MKRALLQLALLFVLDRLLGRVADFLYARTRDGDTGETINALLAKPHDVVVFGSSRAEAHYMPGIMAPVLSASVFNAGFKGSNILYDYGLEELLLDHYVPKVIIYDFSSFSVTKSHANPYDKLYPLYPFWRNAHVWELIAAGGYRATLPFLSRIYPYNSKFHSLLIFNVLQHRADAYQGFNGSSAVMADAPLDSLNYSERDYDPLLVEYLERFIELAQSRGARVLVVESPRRAYGSFPLPATVLALLRRTAVPVLDYPLSEHPEFQSFELYRDADHLNDSGARQFSAALARRLK